MNQKEEQTKFNDNHYYSMNNDPLSELAQDIIEEIIFFREDGNLPPPLPTSIANDADLLDNKVSNKNNGQ